MDHQQCNCFITDYRKHEARLKQIRKETRDTSHYDSIYKGYFNDPNDPADQAYTVDPSLLEAYGD
jgi:hypothetical protein